MLTGLLTGCGDAETTIIEKDPIIIEPGHDDDHGHNHGNDITIESLGRIAVLSEQDMSVTLLDIDDGAELDHFAVANEGSALHPSASFRYAVVASRTAGTVEFIDGGLWREDHQEHLHDFEQAPRTSSYSLSGTRPTHISSHDGKMAIFYDGDSDAGLPASVHLISDADITTSNSNPAAIDYTVNMHGVAKPGDDVVLATFRRDDSESTSGNVILPDQVAVYHKHDGEFEQEQVLSTLCPDLHGAAVNHEFFVFGCGDGVLAAHAHDDEFESMKIANIDAIDGMRIGTLYGHEDSELFFGIASNRTTGERVFVSVNPESSSMEAIEWESNAAPVSYTFNYHGDKFIILDDQGVISKFEIHEHEGEMEF